MLIDRFFNAANRMIDKGFNALATLPGLGFLSSSTKPYAAYYSGPASAGFYGYGFTPVPYSYYPVHSQRQQLERWNVENAGNPEVGTEEHRKAYWDAYSGIATGVSVNQASSSFRARLTEETNARVGIPVISR